MLNVVINSIDVHLGQENEIYLTFLKLRHQQILSLGLGQGDNFTGRLCLNHDRGGHDIIPIPFTPSTFKK